MEWLHSHGGSVTAQLLEPTFFQLTVHDGRLSILINMKMNSLHSLVIAKGMHSSWRYADHLRYDQA